MKTVRDKDFLIKFAKAAQSELRRLHVGAPFRLKKVVKPVETNTDGWRVSVGAFGGYKCGAEIWLDRFTAHSDRKVYYCLFSHQKDGIDKLAHNVKRELGKHLSIYKRDWDHGSEDCRLAKKLAKTRNFFMEYMSMIKRAYRKMNLKGSLPVQ